MTNFDTGSVLPALQRPAFFDGERLTAADLDGAQDYAEQLRWLHARALHDWGIALGLEVAGAPGSATVVVGAGYAVDRLGREVVVSTDTELPVPSVSGGTSGAPSTWFLCASFPDTASFPDSASLSDARVPERRPGAFGSSGAVRWPAGAALRWLEQDPALEARRGLDLVLAAVPVAGCRLVSDAATAGRRDGTPGGTPYVSAGSTAPGGTPWQVWQIGEARPGVRTVVPTTEAGFRSVPFYQAQLAGERVLSTAIDGSPLDVLVDGSSYIAEATATGFELRVALLGLTSLGVSRSDVVAAEDLLAVIGRFGVPMLNLYSYYQNNKNNPRTTLTTGDGLPMYVDSGGGSFTTTGQYHVITVQDMLAGFEHFAQRHAVTLDELARQNTIDLSGGTPLSLRIGAHLVVSRGTTPVNPLQVTSQPGFLDDLRTKLGWHVTWLGVER